MKIHCKNRGKYGFTLVELLIVVGIIAVLVGLLGPAVLKTVRTAERKRRAVEKETLESALMEYWHDNKGWPVADPPSKDGADVDDDTGAIWTYTGDDTSKVWARLLESGADSNYNIRKRDYIDTLSHNTVKSFTDDPERDSESDNVGTIRDIVKNGKITNPIVYWASFIECKECSEWNDQNSSTCKACGHRFERAEKRRTVRGVRPYKIEIDLMSNTVKVSE